MTMWLLHSRPAALQQRSLLHEAQISCALCGRVRHGWLKHFAIRCFQIRYWMFGHPFLIRKHIPKHPKTSENIRKHPEKHPKTSENTQRALDPASDLLGSPFSSKKVTGNLARRKLLLRDLLHLSCLCFRDKNLQSLKPCSEEDVCGV